MPLHVQEETLLYKPRGHPTNPHIHPLFPGVVSPPVPSKRKACGVSSLDAKGAQVPLRHGKDIPPPLPPKSPDPQVRMQRSMDVSQLQWNPSITDNLVPEFLSIIAECPLWRGYTYVCILLQRGSIMRDFTVKLNLRSVDHPPPRSCAVCAQP